MNISASMVKELRDQTGIGMMECKSALVESGGDLDKAIVYLRERGMSRAQKKAGRATSEGMVVISSTPDGKKAALVEVNCETDFVSKNEDFIKFSDKVAQIALAKSGESAEQLLDETFVAGATVKEKLAELIATIGENLQVRRLTSLSEPKGVVAGYSHLGGKIGTLVAIEGVSGDSGLQLAKDLAMHVAAAAPKYLNSSEVDASELETEKQIARTKLIEEGKPEAMIEKILGGQMTKFYKEVCLVEQAYIRDPKMTVKQVVEAAAKGAKITGFSRFQLGEGVEKKTEDFAEEVAKLSK